MRISSSIRNSKKNWVQIGLPLLLLIALPLVLLTLSQRQTLKQHAAAPLSAPPTNFQTTQVIGTGLDGPSGFEFAPDGRIFIIQRTGEIKIYKNGALLPTNFAVLPSIASGDRGLIGIAFDPDFTTNHYAYFYYTGLDKLNRLVRFDASADTGTNPYVLYQTTFPSEQLHVGGTIRFGPDGKLYFAVGDNGYGPNAQDLSNPHGKMLRINKDGSIPLDNPFVGTPGALPEIWAYGLRNPWRFQFDSVTGNLYDGDVGADSWEEINHIVKGGNYGWPNCEGNCLTPSVQYLDPLFTYPHKIGDAYQSSAVTMGPVYHGQMFPQEYQGRLFYGDYARGTIRTLAVDTSGDKLTGEYDFDSQAGSVVDMKIAADGSMYYITYYPGAMYRVSYSTTNHVPVAVASSDVLKGQNPFTAHFSSSGTYDPDQDPLTYKWDFGDGTSSTEANPTKVYTKDGPYTVELTVSDGTNVAQARPIVIQVGCAPVVTIGQPANNSTYKAGDAITVTASALDCAGFDINDASLSTTVKFHHTTHIHPFLDNLPGRSHTFVVPTDGEPSPVTWFEIDVTATDTNGLATTAVTQIYPLKSTMTFATEPAGLPILLDGIPTQTTQAIQGVVGFVREVNVSAQPQLLNGKYYVFDHWSDGGTQRHTIATPATDTTYTAVFKETTAQADPPLTYTIYDELLGGDWIDWSWDSTVNFTGTTAYTGSKGISWVANKGWGGFFIHRNELPLDMTDYSSLSFAARATQAGQKIQVQMSDDKDQPLGGAGVFLSNYGGDPPVGSWKVYTIPLKDLGVTTQKINDLQIQNYTDTAKPALYLDRIGFVGNKAIATPTLLPTATGNPLPTTTTVPTATPKPTATPTIPLVPSPTPSLVPTSTPKPTAGVTPTTNPQSTRISLLIGLHGIGSAGDTVNPASTGNTSPSHPQRTVSVTLYDVNNTPLPTKTGTITYATGTGDFRGTINVGTVPTGFYRVKVATPSYLTAFVPGIISVTAGQGNPTTVLKLTAGEVTGDGKIDILDYNALLDCYSDLTPAKNCNSSKKLITDLTDDQKVNNDDLNLFLRELSVKIGE